MAEPHGRSEGPMERDIVVPIVMCNNPRGHSLNVVQRFPLSVGDKHLQGFQGGGIVIPTSDVEGNQK